MADTGGPGARRRSSTGTRSRGRAAPRGRDPGTASGWLAKIVLLGLVDALALTGLVIAVGQEAWGYVARPRRDARGPERRVPAPAVRADEVPAARAVLPRRVRHLPRAVHGVRVDDELRHRLRAVARPGDRPDPEPVDQPHRGVDGLRRDADARARTARSPATALYDPETEELFLGTTDGLEPLEDDAELQVLTHDRAHVRRQRRRPRGRAPGQVRPLPGYPADPEAYVMPGPTEGSEIRISGGQAFEARPDAGRTTRRPTTMTDTETGVVYTEQEGQFVVARRRRAAARVHDRRRLLQLPRGAHGRRVPRRLPARAAVDDRVLAAVGLRHVRRRSRRWRWCSTSRGCGGASSTARC